MDGAGALVDALDDDLPGVEADQPARDLVVRIVRRRDADRRAGGDSGAGIDGARRERRGRLASRIASALAMSSWLPWPKALTRSYQTSMRR